METLKKRIASLEAQLERIQFQKEAHRARAILAEARIQSVVLIKYNLTSDNRGYVFMDELFEVINRRDVTGK